MGRCKKDCPSQVACLYRGLFELEGYVREFLEFHQGRCNYMANVYYLLNEGKIIYEADQCKCDRNKLKTIYEDIGNNIHAAINDCGMANYPQLGDIALIYNYIINKCLGSAQKPNKRKSSKNKIVPNICEKDGANIVFENYANFIRCNFICESEKEAKIPLVVCGVLRMYNKGSEDASIGNIVFTLQRRENNQWVNVASNILFVSKHNILLNATPRNICAGEITLNEISGDTKLYTLNNDIINREIKIKPDQVEIIKYQSTFNLEGYPAGTPFQLQTIITYEGAQCCSFKGINYLGDGNLYDGIKSVSIEQYFGIPDFSHYNLSSHLCSNISVSYVDIYGNDSITYF